MGVLLSISTVLFVILCVLLVIVILLQSDKSAGLGLIGASSQSTFGSSTADVITKITAGMVALFMVGALGLAVLESQRTISLERKILETKDDAEDTINVESGDRMKVVDKKEVPSERESIKETNVLHKKIK